jgi:hypothetical protein
MENGARYDPLRHTTINPFEVIGLDPRTPMKLEDVHRHIRNKVMRHVFEASRDSGLTTGPDVPTWRQVNLAREVFLATNDIRQLRRCWQRSTRLRWNPMAPVGSADAKRPPPNSDAYESGKQSPGD